MKKEHILIVGGTRGIGLALSKIFAKNNYIVSVIGRNPPIRKRNHLSNIYYWAIDLLDKENLDDVLSEIINQKGKLKHLVFLQRYRGAGDDWAGEIETTLTSTKYVIERLSDQFDNTEDNSIVLVGSTAGSFIVSEQPLSYHVAKAGLINMVRYYAVSLGSKGIRVNCVSPCAILKEETMNIYLKNRKLINLYKLITPLGRMGTAEDVARVIAFLCSTGGSFITGQNIMVDGGISLKWQDSLPRQLIMKSRLWRAEE